MSLFRKGAVMEKASEGMADQLEKALRDSLPDDLTPEQVAALDPSRFEMAEYDDTLAEKTGYSSYSYWRSTFRSSSPICRVSGPPPRSTISTTGPS